MRALGQDMWGQSISTENVPSEHLFYVIPVISKMTEARHQERENSVGSGRISYRLGWQPTSEYVQRLITLVPEVSSLL